MQAKILTLSNGRKIRFNTPEEEAAIKVAIATDPDTYEVSPNEFKHMRRRGRPIGSGAKAQVTLRLDVEILEKFKSTGAGWQTRINAVLRDAVEHGAVAP